MKDKRYIIYNMSRNKTYLYCRRSCNIITFFLLSKKELSMVNHKSKNKVTPLNLELQAGNIAKVPNVLYEHNKQTLLCLSLTYQA